MRDEVVLQDGTSVALDGERLAVRDAHGNVRWRYPLAHVANMTLSDVAPQVFVRLVTAEELVFPASTYQDAERIAGWVNAAPRLQRRVRNQKRARRSQALEQLVVGASLSFGGVAIMLYTYMAAKPGGWFVVPFGAIMIGAVQATRGALAFLLG